MKKALVVQTGDWIPDTDQLVEYLESLRIALGDNYYIIVALLEEMLNVLQKKMQHNI